MKIKKTYFEIAYRTKGGGCHHYSCYAADKQEAIDEARSESYCSYRSEDWYHSVVNADEYTEDYIFEEE